MNQKEIIDLWKTVVVENKNARIEIFESNVFIFREAEEYSISPDAIEQVDVFQLDHMSFDTLILRITTQLCIFEIPYYIDFDEYRKEGNLYLIPTFKIKPIILGFEELIKWLSDTLSNFELFWLDESKPILHDNNLVKNYKKNSA